MVSGKLGFIMDQCCWTQEVPDNLSEIPPLRILRYRNLKSSIFLEYNAVQADGSELTFRGIIHFQLLLLPY
jgi:hypothetical protein